ncbi:hypothetical protein Hanom_Chr08g00722091 [Helianthus anomalus]
MNISIRWDVCFRLIFMSESYINSFILFVGTISSHKACLASNIMNVLLICFARRKNTKP